MTPAKRGDLIVVRRILSATFLAGGISSSSAWYVGRVTKVDRDGWATEFEYATRYGLVSQTLRGRQGESWGKSLDGLGTLIASKDSVDVDAALAAVTEPLDSLVEVRETIGRFLRDEVRPGA